MIYKSSGNALGGTLFFVTLSGGFGAVLTNGNFWQGAATGLIVSGLNHTMHMMKPDDIIVLLAEDGAGGHGHMGIIVGDDENGWFYLSKDGREYNPSEGNQDGTLLTGGKSTYTISKKFANYQEALDYSKTKYNYNKAIKYSTNLAQDVKAIKATTLKLKENFHVLTNNCGQAVSEGLKAAGLSSGSPFVVVPNNKFHSIYIYNKRIYKQGTLYNLKTK